ncbi:hypothetical protein HAX54_029899 [Datura stramonium]|uniref:Uncharacterized protein n=1 Tax=Datura stramonium TaxID=4076 RepID=A0ABS8V9J0_DATST|nr:hypothetical protein [Datura stramonium]
MVGHNELFFNTTGHLIAHSDHFPQNPKTVSQTYGRIVRAVERTYGPLSMLVGFQVQCLQKETRSNKKLLHGKKLLRSEEGNNDDEESRDDDNEAEESVEKENSAEWSSDKDCAVEESSKQKEDSDSPTMPDVRSKR